MVDGDGGGKGDPQTKNDFFVDGSVVFIQKSCAPELHVCGKCG